MWNSVQGVFVCIVCNDSGLNVSGLGRTLPFDGILQDIHSYHPVDAGIRATMSLTGAQE